MPSKTKSKLPSLSSQYATYGGSFTMPGDFTVKIEVLGRSEAQEEMGTNLAQYYHGDHKILLRKSRSLKERRADLEHELAHMCIDWADHFIRKSIAQ